jgi:catechol 2,3-dioxygenase-like lactoylglutathione lyase family enzyme
VELAVGEVRPFDEEAWRDAVVLVERGEIALVCAAGGRRTFRRGDVLWFAGLDLRELHNAGAGPAVLVAVSRAGEARGPDGGGSVVRLGHLNLTVSDLERSAAFYARWFGFDRVLAEYADGTRFVGDASGFELGLHEGAVPALGARWHFGFLAPDAGAVRDLRNRMLDEAIVVDEWEDTVPYVGFKCHDPDGYMVEVYFEPR